MHRDLRDRPQGATVYRYRLLRKISPRREIGYSHAAAGLLCPVALTALQGWKSLPVAVLALPIMAALHLLVLRLTLRRVETVAFKRWTFRADWPGLGPYPATDSSLRLFRRVHAHLSLVGLCFAALFYPWSSSLFVALVFWHLWLLAPRLWLLVLLRRENPDIVLRFDRGELWLYLP
jgi:hypothetical protein